MKILHLIPNLSGGGAERQLGYLAPELARAGHDVHIAYSNDGPHKPEFPGVVLHRLKSRSNYDPYLFWQLVKIIRVIKPDIIHTWILQTDILGGIAALILKVPWILHEQSSASAFPRKWKIALRCRLARQGARILSNSHGGDRCWKAVVPDNNRFVIGNVLPLASIDSVSASWPASKHDSKCVKVLYAGRLVNDGGGQKNLLQLLDALAVLRKTHPVSAVFCGDGPQKTELERRRHDLGLDNDVLMPGHCSSETVWAAMKAADVFVSLSAFEGCPNAMMEAMACRCPLVLSDIPAHREVVDENSAVLVSPSDTTRVADAVVSVLDNPAATRQRGENAFAKTANWSIEAMASKYLAVYEQVVSDRGSC